METLSPYQAPASAPPPFPAPQVVARPGAATAFGILNLLTPLVVAGVLAVMIFALQTHPHQPNPVMKLPGVRATYLFVIPASFLTGGLMFGSGCALLRGNRQALIWANLYALVSILTKSAYLVLTILILIPARMSMPKEITASGGTVSSHGSQLLGATIITAIPAIYPLLAAALLNRRVVKDWLASREEARRYGIA
ncbi:MAG: hypothetical protein JWO82_671 [Akkermansiaceae bacterium]|nr:hypothetical protein [Akkermansiaceae bacterium]